MTSISSVHRTLEHELFALLRGASLECPVCGEFVLHDGAAVRCPECEMTLRGRIESNVLQVEFGSQAG
jgi:rubrerythrin